MADSVVAFLVCNGVNVAYFSAEITQNNFGRHKIYLKKLLKTLTLTTKLSYSEENKHAQRFEEGSWRFRIEDALKELLIGEIGATEEEEEA